MGFRYIDIELSVTTATRVALHRSEFVSGLNVIQAPNSWGKSTLVQSLVYGLGLEGAFSTSHLSPLGEAMSSVIDLNGQREGVVESSVTLTIVNDSGQYLRTRRFAQSLTYETGLIQTWTANSIESLDQAERRDLFVRQSGGATHELGFHRLLEDFIGLELPKVPGFNGDEIKLYLEVVLPLFYIEQKFGWSGLAPRVPTHYRIRSPYRRAAEYALGLHSLERLKKRDGLTVRLARVRDEWTSSNAELMQIAAQQGWTLSRPLTSADDEQMLDAESDVGTDTDGLWVSAAAQLDEMRAQLARISSIEIQSASARTESAKLELVETETQLTSMSGRYRAQREMLSAAQSEVAALGIRSEELQQNRETLLDVRKLERLGSEIHSSALGSAHCPTCAQSLDSGSVATGLVLDITANLGLLDAEKSTLSKITSAANRNLAASKAATERTSSEIESLRARVRGLKDELIGPSGSPSVAQIEARLALREEIRSVEVELARAHSTFETLRDRAAAIARIREQLRLLRSEDEGGEDSAIIRRFRTLFSAALDRFALRSLPASEVTIGADSLLPEQGGFELTFDIQHGLSASDAIRTKWAHYVAMAKAAAESPTGHPLGVLIIDEPRQQEAEVASVRALYVELANVAESTQVIVASSASDAELAELLAEVPVHLIATTGDHMFALAE
jgi:hypothetical protein